MIKTESFLVNRPCPICAGDKFRMILESAADPFFAERFGLKIATIVKCLSCHTRYTNPILKPEIDALQYLESEGYNQIPKGSPESCCSEDQLICFREIFEYNSIKNKRLLDIGCGEGGLVSLCQSNHIDAHGIELNINAVRRAKKAGIPNITSTRFEDIETSSFDIITSIHVMEHLRDCREFAFHTKRILKDKGLILIIVPNYFVFQYRLKHDRYWKSPFQHMNGLTSWSLDYLFHNFGFQRLPIRANISDTEANISMKTRISVYVTKIFGNALNVFFTKLFCIYQRQ